MIAKNVSKSDLERALETINRDNYQGNITWNREPEYIGRTREGGDKWRFTLTVKDSSKVGSRRSDSGRRIAAACWHTHGDFFDALLELNRAAVIEVAGGKVITVAGGNWEDYNIGSLYRPFYASEACECG